jgi:hypothetical protein
MPGFDLDEIYSVTYTRYRTDNGFVAKGVLRHHGKPVQIFEAHGSALHRMSTVARLGAEEIYRKIKMREAKKRESR